MRAKYVLAGSGLALGLLGLLMVAAVTVLPQFSLAGQKLDVLYEAPTFSLTDSEGQPFTPGRLEGKVWVIDFIFTTCQGPCPMLSGQMSSLDRRFRNDGRVHFVSVSVDPENDTPPVLKAYAANLAADTSKWHFLTGPRATINKLAVEGFKLGSGDKPAMHDTHFVLVDGRGRVRGYYTGTDPADVDELAVDIRHLLKEKGE